MATLARLSVPPWEVRSSSCSSDVSPDPPQGAFVDHVSWVREPASSIGGRTYNVVEMVFLHQPSIQRAHVSLLSPLHHRQTGGGAHSWDTPNQRNWGRILGHSQGWIHPLAAIGLGRRPPHPWGDDVLGGKQLTRSSGACSSVLFFSWRSNGEEMKVCSRLDCSDLWPNHCHLQSHGVVPPSSSFVLASAWLCPF